jgi:hypothetical protein
MFLATILTPDVIDSLIVLVVIAVCALPFCLGHILAMQAPSTVRQPDPGEDEGRPRPRGIRPRGFQVQATGASAPADVEAAERQRVAARIKAEEDQRSQRHAGWENLVQAYHACFIESPGLWRCRDSCSPKLKYCRRQECSSGAAE